LKHKAKAYQDMGSYTGTTDADPHTLIGMLYSGALERIAAAKGAMSSGDVAAKGLLISKAIAIIDGLRAHLDREQGGDLANNLAALYDYAENTLFQANLTNDSAKLDEVSVILTNLYTGWEDIRQTVQDINAAKQANE